MKETSPTRAAQILLSTTSDNTARRWPERTHRFGVRFRTYRLNIPTHAYKQSSHMPHIHTSIYTHYVIIDTYMLACSHADKREGRAFNKWVDMSDKKKCT